MEQHVNRFIKKYSLTEKKLSVTALVRIFKTLGYKPVLFNKYGNSRKVQKLITACGLENEVATRKVFIFSDPSVKFVFIHGNISYDEMVHYMLHELGHIWLGHIDNPGNEDVQEREADEFAVRVRLTLKQQLNTKRMTAVLSVASVLIISFLVGNHIYTELDTYPDAQPIQSYSAEISVEANTDIDTEYVVVTPSGKKFHRPDCMYVRDKANVIELSPEEAVNVGYEPCKVCKP